MNVKLHKTKKAKFIYTTIVCSLLAVTLLYSCRGRKVTITQYSSIDRPAKVQPDYAGSVIPPNIAPLNFVIKQDGAGYFVKIYSENGKPIEIFSRKPTIVIPKQAWHELLGLNRGRQLNMDVYVESSTGVSSSKGENTVRTLILSSYIEGFNRAMAPGEIWVPISVILAALKNQLYSTMDISSTVV